ncbi:hypothetical protein PAMA_016308 [Pampus argenteus]
MSSTTTGFNEERRSRAAQELGMGYIPTEAEKMVLKECNMESFWYRSVPFSAVSMAITQALIVRGTLSASPKFGSIPKVAFAGLCAYIAGKLSYIKVCQKKFMQLENSPMGDALRQSTGLSPQYSKGPQSEMSDPDTQSFDTMFQPAEYPGQMSAQTRDYGYGYNPEPPVKMKQTDDFSVPVQSYVEEEEPRRKATLYEDLRLKNRENYEVKLTQKAETLIKPSPEKGSERPRKDVKKTIYGDTWEE